MAIGDRKNVVMESDIGSKVPAKSHAAQHAASGGDPITPQSIGALPTAGGTVTGDLTVAGQFRASNPANPLEIGKYIDFHETGSEDYSVRLLSEASTGLLYLAADGKTFPILTAGNYDNYALPLTGGTMRGPLTMLTDNDQAFINLYNQPTNTFTRVYSNNNTDTVIQSGSNASGVISQINFSSNHPHHFYTVKWTHSTLETVYEFLHAGNFTQYINVSSIGGVQIYFGSYTGNSAEERDIPLGFQPKAVLLMAAQGGGWLYERGETWGGLFMPGLPLRTKTTSISGYTVYNAAEVTSTGFKVYHNRYSYMNYSEYQYYYIAFK